MPTRREHHKFSYIYSVMFTTYSTKNVIQDNAIHLGVNKITNVMILNKKPNGPSESN